VTAVFVGGRTLQDRTQNNSRSVSERTVCGVNVIVKAKDVNKCIDYAAE